VLASEPLDDQRDELVTEVRIERIQPERLVGPLGVPESVERGVAGGALRGRIFGESEAGEHLEVARRSLQRGETRDAEAVGRLEVTAGLVLHLAALEGVRAAVLLPVQGGHQYERHRCCGRHAGRDGHAAMLSRSNTERSRDSRVILHGIVTADLRSALPTAVGLPLVAGSSLRSSG
jgi:hypothetical protein